MNYIICPECEGRETVEREVRVSTMNSGGFAYIDLECPTCKGEGEIAVDDPFEARPLRSLSEVASEIEETEAVR